MVAPVRNRSETLGRLADLAPHLLSRGVTSLRVFGSAGRDATTDDSDVDILVEFDRPVGAFELLDLQDELARMLGRPVDLVSTAGIKERMRARIEREAGLPIRPVSRNELHEEGGLLVNPRTGTWIDDTLVRELIDAARHRD
jgi:uncharacterized protein